MSILFKKKKLLEGLIQSNYQYKNKYQHSVTIIVKIDLGNNYKRNLKPSGRSLMRNNHLHSLRSSPHRIFTNCKGKILTSQKKPDGHHHNQMTKITITNNGTD